MGQKLWVEKKKVEITHARTDVRLYVSRVPGLYSLPWQAQKKKGSIWEKWLKGVPGELTRRDRPAHPWKRNHFGKSGKSADHLSLALIFFGQSNFFEDPVADDLVFYKFPEWQFFSKVVHGPNYAWLPAHLGTRAHFSRFEFRIYMCDIFLRDDTEDCGKIYQVLEIFYHFFPVMHLDANKTKFTQLRRGRRE